MNSIILSDYQSSGQMQVVAIIKPPEKPPEKNPPTGIKPFCGIGAAIITAMVMTLLAKPRK